MSTRAYPSNDPNSPDPGRTHPRAPGDLAVWFDTVRTLTRQVWRQLLVVALVGLAAPAAVTSLAASITGIYGGLVVVPGVGRGIEHVLWLVPRLLVTLVVAVAAGFVASAGWAAGCRLLTLARAGGRPGGVLAAFRYGFGRAPALWPWAVVAGAAVLLGLRACVLPGLYAIFAFSMFGFVAVFERGRQPLVRSVALTHVGIGGAAAKIGLSLLPYLIYQVLTSLLNTVTYQVVTGIASITGAVTGVGTSDGLAVLRGLLALTNLMLLAPALAAMLVGLYATYLDLRSGDPEISPEGLIKAL